MELKFELEIVVIFKFEFKFKIVEEFKLVFFIKFLVDFVELIIDEVEVVNRVFENIEFEIDKVVIRLCLFELFNELVLFLLEYFNWKFRIIGYIDNMGIVEWNMDLFRCRVEVV